MRWGRSAHQITLGVPFYICANYTGIARDSPFFPKDFVHQFHPGITVLYIIEVWLRLQFSLSVCLSVCFMP